MQRWASERGRRGNVLFIVSILGLLLCGAVFSLGFLTKTDVTTSSNMLRESLATNVAESIAAQMEAQVNVRPWYERFWFLEAQARGDVADPAHKLPFDKTTPYVNLSKDSLPLSEIDFSGVIKDLPGELRQYRLYLEVTIKGETYAFSWDKKWEQSLLAGMNRDSTQVDKPLDTGNGTTAPADELIEGIKDRINTAPPPDNSGAAQVDRIGRLKDDETNFDAATVDPDVDAPRVPRAPRR